MKPKPITAVVIALAVVVVLLVLGVPPLWLVLIALVAACPLSMAFMHGGHGGHGGGSQERDGGTSAGHQHDDHGGTDLTKKGPQHH